MSEVQRTLDELERRAELGGGEERLRRQRAAGKLTARERVDLLFDPGTFEELNKLVTHRCRDFGMADQVIPGDGVIAATDAVVAVVCASRKTSPCWRIAAGDERGENRQSDGSGDEDRRPIVGLNDSGGARIQEGVVSLAATPTSLRNTLASGFRKSRRSWGRAWGASIPGDHGFHHHGPRLELHVRHRTRRSERSPMKR